MIALADIQRAGSAIHRRVHRTPFLTSRSVSERAGCHVLVKAECLQRTGSFKVRGVFNKLGSLTEAEAARGVIGISAGNHAQALAYAAARVGFAALLSGKIPVTPSQNVVIIASGGNMDLARLKELL